MFTGWTAEQLFQPATNDVLFANGQPYSAAAGGSVAGPPVFAAPSIGLRPFIEQAFTREHVVIDFAGFSGETLHGAIQEPLDKIRLGLIKPETVTLRLLLPDTSRPMVLPYRVEDLSDDPDYRARMHQLTSRHAYAIVDLLQELTRLGLISEASTQIRAHPAPPMFKLYILNGEEVFFGLYPIVKHNIPFANGDRDIYDLMGKDAVVFHHSIHSSQPAGPRLVQLHVGPHQLRVPRMTDAPKGGDGLDAIIARTRWLLIDFDGPICSIFAGLPASTVADHLRKVVTELSVPLPEEVERTQDPMEVFAWSATVSPELAERVEGELTAQEVTAVATAEPTPYIHDVLAACREAGRITSVVSNNSDRAVNTYLTRHGLADRAGPVFARTSHDPALLKPSPHLINMAVRAINADPTSTALVGDSITDVDGARLAGIDSIGYANKPGKRDRMIAARAGSVVNTMADLALSIRASRSL